MTYLSRLLSAATRDGTDLDRTENAILDGNPRQTISMHCALAAQRGDAWGCWACRALAVLVQRGHCAKQLTGAPMAAANYARAIVCLTAIPALLGWGVVALVRWAI